MHKLIALLLTFVIVPVSYALPIKQGNQWEKIVVTIVNHTTETISYTNWTWVHKSGPSGVPIKSTPQFADIKPGDTVDITLTGVLLEPEEVSEGDVGLSIGRGGCWLKAGVGVLHSTPPKLMLYGNKPYSESINYSCSVHRNDLGLRFVVYPKGAK